MKVFIPRAQWLRGEGAASSSLHRPIDNKGCCLGHVLMAAGIPQTMLTGYNTPAEIINFEQTPTTPGDMPEGLVKPLRGAPTPLGAWVRNSDICIAAMTVNDSTLSDDEYREHRLTELLGEIGIEVTFG